MNLYRNIGIFFYPKEGNQILYRKILSALILILE